MLVARTQTLVQFSDELLARLDGYRTRVGRSRSDVIREAVERYLGEDHEVQLDRQIVAGYTREPPDDAWTDEAARRMIAAEPW
jgi:metal-responsive CopG/Arc/MetJ family transcriptional regulator